MIIPPIFFRTIIGLVGNWREKHRRRGVCRATLVTAAVLGIVGSAPASPAMAAFCQTAIVHNYAKPLERMPDLRKPPMEQHLPFGPARVFFGQIGHGPLLVGQSAIGFSLSYSPYRRNHHLSPRLDWNIVTRLTWVDQRGRAKKVLGVIEKRVNRLRSTDDRPSGDLSLAFDVSKPGLYRIESIFRDQSGKRLGRFGEYIRVLRPSLDVRLTLNGMSFRPGDTVSARLENYGTEPLFYGLGYSIEYYDGASWARPPTQPTYTVVPAIGLSSGPGQAASCWNFPIPTDAPSGRYRFVRDVEHFAGGLLPRKGKTLTLAAEFNVAP